MINWNWQTQLKVVTLAKSNRPKKRALQIWFGVFFEITKKKNRIFFQTNANMFCTELNEKNKNKMKSSNRNAHKIQLFRRYYRKIFETESVSIKMSLCFKWQLVCGCKLVGHTNSVQLATLWLLHLRWANFCYNEVIIQNNPQVFLGFAIQKTQNELIIIKICISSSVFMQCCRVAKKTSFSTSWSVISLWRYTKW